MLLCLLESISSRQDSRCSRWLLYNRAQQRLCEVTNPTTSLSGWHSFVLPYLLILRKHTHKVLHFVQNKSNILGVCELALKCAAFRLLQQSNDKWAFVVLQTIDCLNSIAKLCFCAVLFCWSSGHVKTFNFAVSFSVASSKFNVWWR